MCAPEGVCVAIPPFVGVSVLTPADAPGWFSRTGADLEILAAVTRDGADPLSATLTIAGCAAARCTFEGTPLGGGQFRFLVPRQVQAVGSEALLPYVVVVTDRAGNQGTAAGALKIDDSAPVIQTFTAMRAGALGEDGNMWFGGPTLEIAVPVSDSGSGVSSVVLRLDPADLKAGAPLAPDPLPASDGTVHFMLPAGNALKEGALHFSLTASDALGHTASVPVSSILVDVAGPVVSAPRVDAANARPAGVCDPTITCGRAGGTQLLRDDVADLTFEATDCGAGIASGAIAVLNGQTVSAVETGTTPSSCANGNPTHHFKATVDFGVAAPSLPAANASGVAALPVPAASADRLGNPGSGAAPTGATSGDGIALISLWRWKRKMVGPATGSPVILPGGGNPRVAVGTASAVTAFTTAGTQSWAQAVSAGVGADLAIGASGKIYAVSPEAPCGSCIGTLTMVSSVGTPVACTQPSVSFGAPPVVSPTGPTSDTAMVVAVRRGSSLLPNVYVYPGNCSVRTWLSPNDLTGIASMTGKMFVSSNAGFTSVDYDGTSFSNPVSYSPQVAAPSAPSLLADPPMNAVFGTSTGDVHRAAPALCGSASCWKDVYVTAPHTAGVVSSTPVYDGTHMYASDDAGNVSSWVQSTGVRDWVQSLATTISPPVILKYPPGVVLVVQDDGVLRLVSSKGAASLLKVAAFGAEPPVPAIEPSGSYGIAYVPDGAGWLWAVNLPYPPLAASSVAWPRPGRDSCNSRSAGAACP